MLTECSIWRNPNIIEIDWSRSREEDIEMVNTQVDLQYKMYKVNYK